MSDDRFEADWLTLREPADHAARSTDLESSLVEALAHRDTPWRIVDLGAGTGSNPRHLAPRLPGPQTWRLVDHDAALLDRAQTALASLEHPDGHALRFDTDCRSLDPIDEVLRSACDLVTASALIDLVSAEWLDALAERVHGLGACLLVTLSVDGRWQFLPTGPESAQDAAEDAGMLSMYRRHQARDKGLGRALGGAAPDRLAASLGARGYEVTTAPSPWRLAAGRQTALARTLLAGWARAILDQAPDRRRAIEAWAAARDAALERGELGVEVGHVDLLGRPP
jgi:SAM-dependent methyltransferase